MDAYKNFAYTTVLTAPSPAASGTSLTLPSGHGALFPVAPFNVTVWPTATVPLASNAEIMRVTAKTGDVLTVTRAQEGTSARTVVVGDQIAATVTEKTLTDLVSASGSGATLNGAAMSRRISNDSAITGERAVPFDTVDRQDTGFTCNAALGRITVTNAGWYSLVHEVSITSATTGYHTAKINIVGGAGVLHGTQISGTLTDTFVSGVAYLDAGTVMEAVYWSSNSTTRGYSSAGNTNYFRVVYLAGGGGIEVYAETTAPADVGAAVLWVDVDDTSAEGGGGGFTRTTATVTTASLAADASESGTVTLANGYRLLRITTSRPARVRLYTTTGKRDADASRAVGTDPTGDHGLTLEYVTTASVLAADLSPVVDGFDGKATPDGVIPYRVTNLDSTTGTVQVDFLWIRSE